MISRIGPSEYIQEFYSLVYYFKSDTKYFDQTSDFILKFKEDIENVVKAWTELAVENINGMIKYDYVIRALGHSELISGSSKALDRLCYQITESNTSVYIPNALTKSRTTRELKSLNYNERQLELNDVYSFDPSGIKDGSAILLIDDILTTGATANCISKIIKDKLPGVSINFFSLAQTSNPEFGHPSDNSHFNLADFERRVSKFRRYDINDFQSREISKYSIILSREVEKTLREYDSKKKERFNQAVKQLITDPKGGGLNPHLLKKIDCKIWEAYLSGGERILYEKNGNELKVWRIGNHKTVDELRNKKIGKNKFNENEFLEYSLQAPDAEENTQKNDYEYLSKKKNVRPFKDFPNEILRLLGVPKNLTDLVRKIQDIDYLPEIVGLSESAIKWLEQVYNDGDLDQIIFSPDQLLYRTNLDKLEGYCHGRIKQLMINLDKEQQAFVDKIFGSPYLLKGCAGSGKSTIGIYKAIKEAMEGKEVAFFTFSRMLSDITKQLIEELIGPVPNNLTISTIDAFASKLLNRIPIISDSERHNLIVEAVEKTKKKIKSSLLKDNYNFISDEITFVIQAYGISESASYLTIKRYGREKALSKKNREIIWEVYNEYMQLKMKTGKFDWAEICQKAHEDLIFGELPEVNFDSIIIDETQDLTPIQLRFVQQLISADDSASLLCLADAGQTIYSRGLSWKAVNLDIRGRTRILKKNYRNTRQIASFAVEILKNNESLIRDNEYIPPESTDKNGIKPVLFLADNSITGQICSKAIDLVSDQTCRLGDIAFLFRTKSQLYQFNEWFRKTGIPTLTSDEYPFNLIDDKIKLLTVHSAKGLEFPIVFLPNISNSNYPFNLSYLTNDPDEYKTHCDKETLLLYVAVTRAAEVLYMYSDKGKVTPFVNINSNNLMVENG